MKKFFLSLVTLVATFLLCFSCSNDETAVPDSSEDYTSITFNVASMRMSQEITRAALSDAFSMIELVLYTINEDGSYTKYKEIDQSSSATSFGVIKMENIKCGTYRLVVLGHGDSSHPDLDDPTDIAFISYPNAYSYSSDITVTKESSNFDVPMTHTSARLRVMISGYIPDEVEKIKCTVEGASNNLNAITELANTTVTRTVYLDVSDTQRANRAFNFNMYIFLTKAELTAADSYVSMTLAGVDAENKEINTKSFEKIPFKKGYATIFSGPFFDYGSTGFNLTVDTSWGEYSSIQF